MKLQRLMLTAVLLLCLVLAQNDRTTEARRLIFYSPNSRTLHSQLLVSRRLPRPCPAGKMRDHRDRCRRALIFGRST